MITELEKPAGIEAFTAGVPGEYENIPAEDYHALDTASQSRLKALARSPLHCRHQIDNPDDDTKPKALGTAGHGCLLEPEAFRQQYALGPDVDLRTKAGKEEWSAFASENDGKCLVRGKDGEKLIGMHRAVWAHPAAVKAITSSRRRELSIVWRDKATQQLCKLRADLDGDVIFDLKTTTDASPEGFAWAIRKFKYDYQAAFYLRGFAAAGIPRDGFGFIAVESEPPHGVAVYALADLDLIDADLEIFGADGLLAEYAACERSGEWPGYENNMKVLRLPSKRRDATV